MNFVSYHQNVFDLLDVQPPEVSTEAAEMIESSQQQSKCPVPEQLRPPGVRNSVRRPRWKRRGKYHLPQSLREWYTFTGVACLRSEADDPYRSPEASLWWVACIASAREPIPLEAVLKQFEQQAALEPSDERFVSVMNCDAPLFGDCHVRLDGSDDPPVWHDRTNVGSFSDFVFDCFVRCGLAYRVPAPPTAHIAGHWLRIPRAPAAMLPLLDQLIDRLDEDPCATGEDGPTTYTFRAPGARLRITTDPWDAAEGHSAWWLAGDTQQALADLAGRVCDVVDLRESLRADTDAGRSVLSSLRRSGTA